MWTTTRNKILTYYTFWIKGSYIFVVTIATYPLVRGGKGLFTVVSKNEESVAFLWILVSGTC